MKRPDFQKMMTEVRKHKFKAIGGNTPTGFSSEPVSKITIDGKARKSYKLVPIAEEIEIPNTKSSSLLWIPV